MDNKVPEPEHFVSSYCTDEVCATCKTQRKSSPATHKLEETISLDDPNPSRHNLTAYVCCKHFSMIMGSATPCYKPPKVKKIRRKIVPCPQCDGGKEMIGAYCEMCGGSGRVDICPECKKPIEFDPYKRCARDAVCLCYP